MGIFKDNEVYDYTLLQKKGFLKKGEEKKPLGRITRDGYVELSSPEESVVSRPSSENPLGLFDTFTPNATASEGSALANFDSVLPSSVPQGLEAKDLAVKIEDFEYKLNRISDKLAEIEEKLSRFEERVK